MRERPRGLPGQVPEPQQLREPVRGLVQVRLQGQSEKVAARVLVTADRACEKW